MQYLILKTSQISIFDINFVKLEFLIDLVQMLSSNLLYVFEIGQIPQEIFDKVCVLLFVL